jgi:hypothetical protein
VLDRYDFSICVIQHFGMDNIKFNTLIIFCTQLGKVHRQVRKRPQKEKILAILRNRDCHRKNNNISKVGNISDLRT